METTVEPTKDDNSRAQREAATADALAKAKAMVEAENANKTKPEEDENRTESDSKPAEPGIDDPSVAPTGKKRGRDEETEAEDLPEAKKLDIQVEEQKGEQLVES